MSSKTTKKLINSPESCVDENLRGVVASYPALRLHPKHRVVTVNSQKVSKLVGVVGGGGSGHEPFASGLVGSGLLHAAVAGDVFASPPTTNVLYAIAHAAKYNEGGVLVVIGNYTGDRLNFGKAIEKAKILGMNVEGLIVGEDVASSNNKTGGRSMVGEVFFFKLCGGMAAKGYNLHKIRSIAFEANKRMATLGVCLTPCSLPGQPPLFEIAPDEMELGAGVHGEAGITKLKLTTAKETVTMILDKIVEHLKLLPGDRVAVMLDNLGSTSVLEMNILCHETKEYLTSKSIHLARLFPGHIKTSLDMHGFQICVLHLNDEYGDLWLDCLDMETDAPAWTGGRASSGDGICWDEELIEAGEEQQNDDARPNLPAGPSLTRKEQQIMNECLLAATRALIDNEALLNRLDSGCGDGDCGNTLRKFAESTAALLRASSNLAPACLLRHLSERAERDMGGTSGGLYSLAFSAAAPAVAQAKVIDRHVWLQSLEAAMDSISKYGGAEPGDRTMLDTLDAAAKAYKQNITSDLKTLLAKIVEAADQGAKDTAAMTARAGRASYVNTTYLTEEDAGARAAAIWIHAALGTLSELNY